MYGMKLREYMKGTKDDDKLNAFWENEQGNDAHAVDKRNWREKIDKRIRKIKRLRIEYLNAKQDKCENTMRYYEEEIQKLKSELRTIILSRDYEY